MNIFALSRNPQEAAQQMLDKHVVKMPTETCQMLHTNALYFDYIEHYSEAPTLAQLKAFHRDIGYRIDLLLASPEIHKSLKRYEVHKDTRHKSWCPEQPKTSDHAPVMIEI